MPYISRVQIEQQAARIGINTIPAKVVINSATRPQMRIIKEPPRMEIERQAPALKVEAQRQRPLRLADKLRLTAPAAVGRPKTPRPVTDLILEAAKSQYPQSSGVSLSAYALELNKALNGYVGAVDSETMPQNMPNIEWEAGYVNISWSNAQMKIEWDKDNYLPSFSVEPHTVEIFLREKPYIKIAVSDEVIAAMYGARLDEEI